MRPERVAGLVVRWTRLYTCGLPSRAARRRLGEIAADLHDQVAHGRERGIPDRRIAREIASRALRGAAADLAWRASTRERTRPRTPLHRSVLRVALGVALVLALPAVGMLLREDVAWSPADFVAAGLLLTAVGVAFELAARRAGNRPVAGGVAALGLAAAAFGEADDAPGLVLLGVLLVAGACAIGVRAPHPGR